MQKRSTLGILEKVEGNPGYKRMQLKILLSKLDIDCLLAVLES